MRMLNIAISDVEYKKFGIKDDKITFTDFIDLINKEIMRQNLNACTALAEEYGLSGMTMDEITSEVRAIRTNDK